MGYSEDELIERTNSFIESTQLKSFTDEDEKDVKEKAREVIEASYRTPQISGHTMDVVAASAFYLANMIEKTGLSQQEIGDVADVATSSIRKCYDKMYHRWRADLADISYEESQSMRTHEVRKIIREKEEE